MKKIVLSAITALVVTVGMYHIALLAGAGEPAAAVIAFVAVAFVAVTFAVGVAQEERVRFRWVALAYATLGLAVLGGLTVGNVGWGAAIVLGGSVVLFALWRAHSRFAAPDAPLAVSAVSEQNGA